MELQEKEGQEASELTEREAAEMAAAVESLGGGKRMVFCQLLYCARGPTSTPAGHRQEECCERSVRSTVAFVLCGSSFRALLCACPPRRGGRRSAARFGDRSFVRPNTYFMCFENTDGVKLKAAKSRELRAVECARSSCARDGSGKLACCDGCRSQAWGAVC